MDARTRNPRRQGDLGEISAIEWLGHQGPVYVPINHSPDVDLVTWWDGRWAGVQVKTTTQFVNRRWSVMICTRGGNRSWSGIAKHFSPDRCDYLFVLVGNGRRWFIPSGAIEATSGIHLGGPKYSEYEIEGGRPLLVQALS